MITLIDNAEIGFDDVGSGFPVVFLHAFPLNRTMWEPQIGALVSDSRCISVDCRGFGDSSATPPYSMDRYADDVIGVLDSLGVERAVFVGLSMGGYLLFAIWRKYAARVRALVLADTRASADTAEGADRRRQLIELARTQGATAVANVQISALMGTTTRERRPDIYDAVHRMMAQADTEAIVGALEAMIGRLDSTPVLSTIDAPTLIIVGEEDTLTPVKDARVLHEAIAGSRLEILSQAGHLSNIERPAAFNAVVGEFFATLLYN